MDEFNKDLKISNDDGKENIESWCQKKINQIQLCIENLAESTRCGICLTVCTVPRLCTECGFIGCQICFLKWLSEKSSCPQCRMSLDMNGLMGNQWMNWVAGPAKLLDKIGQIATVLEKEDKIDVIDTVSEDSYFTPTNSSSDTDDVFIDSEISSLCSDILDVAESIDDILTNDGSDYDDYFDVSTISLDSLYSTAHTDWDNDLDWESLSSETESNESDSNYFSDTSFHSMHTIFLSESDESLD